MIVANVNLRVKDVIPKPTRLSIYMSAVAPPNLNIPQS